MNRGGAMTMMPGGAFFDEFDAFDPITIQEEWRREKFEEQKWKRDHQNGGKAKCLLKKNKDGVPMFLEFESTPEDFHDEEVHNSFDSDEQDNRPRSYNDRQMNNNNSYGERGFDDGGYNNPNPRINSYHPSPSQRAPPPHHVERRNNFTGNGGPGGPNGGPGGPGGGPGQHHSPGPRQQQQHQYESKFENRRRPLPGDQNRRHSFSTAMDSRRNIDVHPSSENRFDNHHNGGGGGGPMHHHQNNMNRPGGGMNVHRRATQPGGPHPSQMMGNRGGPHHMGNGGPHHMGNGGGPRMGNGGPNGGPHHMSNGPRMGNGGPHHMGNGPPHQMMGNGGGGGPHHMGNGPRMGNGPLHHQHPHHHGNGEMMGNGGDFEDHEGDDGEETDTGSKKSSKSSKSSRWRKMRNRMKKNPKAPPKRSNSAGGIGAGGGFGDDTERGYSSETPCKNTKGGGKMKKRWSISAKRSNNNSSNKNQQNEESSNLDTMSTIPTAHGYMDSLFNPVGPSVQINHNTQQAPNNRNIHAFGKHNPRENIIRAVH